MGVYATSHKITPHCKLNMNLKTSFLYYYIQTLIKKIEGKPIIHYISRKTIYNLENQSEVLLHHLYKTSPKYSSQA